MSEEFCCLRSSDKRQYGKLQAHEKNAVYTVGYLQEVKDVPTSKVLSSFG